MLHHVPLLLLAMQNPELERTAQWMSGVFDTFQQVYEDEQAKKPYQHVRAILKVKPIDLPGLELPQPYRALYLEEALAGSSDKPYRQRVIVLTVNEQGQLQNLDYRLKGTPDSITKDTIQRESGCEVTWTKVREDLLRGEAGKTGNCKTSQRGATRVVSSIELTPNSLTSLDQGFDDSGAQKWGPPPGTIGHVFRKQPQWKPTSDSIRMTMFNAAPYRSKVVRLRARVRPNQFNYGQRAQLWLRVDRPNRQMGFFDNMQDRPIYQQEWKYYDITGPVAPDAERIALGMILASGAKVDLEDVSFEIIADAPTAPLEPARPLTQRARENLKAFARLYGYARFFHPTLEATKADWDALALSGVNTAEPAADAADLAARLAAWAKPFAPDIQIWTSSRPAPTSNWQPTAEMVQWEHQGFGTNSPNSIYRSNLAKVSGTPVSPFRSNIGGGIEVMVPLAMAAFEKGTPTKSYMQYSGDDRTTRLAGVIIAWNIFQHFYPYFDVIQTDWPSELEKALQSAASDQDGAAYELTLQRMVAALHDGHGRVVGGASDRAPLPWRLEWVEERVVNGETADTVLSVDGKPVLDLLREQESLISGATPQWIRYRALSQLGMGPRDGEVTVEIEPVKEPGTRRMVKLKRSTTPPMAKRPEKVAELEPGVWYVDLTRLKDDDWKLALPSLEAAKGIVFDLRGYPSVSPGWLSHLSETSLLSAQWHTPRVKEPDRNGMLYVRRGEWNLPPAKPLLKAKRAVMTNGSAISYAESTLGIVENYRLAEIVGETTAGTNGNVNTFELPGGYRVFWTGMKVLKQDGSRHHGVGIRPTIPAARTRAGIAAGRDEVLEKAVAAVE